MSRTLVIFEGHDNCGKTTLIKEVSKHIPCIVTKEPGSSLVPENLQIREMVLNNKELLPMQRELLFYTDALGHKRALEKLEGLILSDRGILSHLAYVFGYMKLRQLGSDADENYTRFELCKKLIDTVCPKPDAVVYLEGSLELMAERSNGQPDAIESLGPDFYKHVLHAYDEQIYYRNIFDKNILKLSAKSSVDANCAKTLEFLASLPGPICHNI